MNWQHVSLEQVLILQSTPVEIRDHIFYHQLALRAHQGVVLKSVKSGLEFPKKQQQLVHTGQFILSRWRMRRSLYGIVPQDLDGGVTSYNVLAFDLHPDLNPDYFAAYLLTSTFRRALARCYSDKGGLQLAGFQSLQILLPSLEQQRHVVDLWDYAKASLAHTIEMVASISDIKVGVAARLFANERSSWEWKRLDVCAELGRDVYGDYMLTFVSRDQLVLGFAHSEPDGIGIVPSPELDPYFLYYYLETQKPYLGSTSSGIKLEAHLRSLLVPLPPLYEQRKIAGVLQQHDQVLDCLHAEQAALRKFTQGILHQIFSGKLHLAALLPSLRDFFAGAHS